MKKLIITIICLIILPFSVKAYDYEYDYEIDNYDIDIVVNEDNKLDITETIDVSFNEPKHGIIRKIPLKNRVTRLNGENTTNRVRINNIKVSDNYSKITNSDEISLKIGNPNEYINDTHTYKISYTYNLGKDPLDELDEFYFNIIGNDWDTIIKNVDFTIEMPKEFDIDKLGFSKGSYGDDDSYGIYYDVMGNTIYGSLSETLNPYEGLTVRLELEDGYFIYDDSLSFLDYLMLIIPITGLIISLFIWNKYGKDEQVIDSVEFYAPDNLNSLELAYLYKGTAESKDVTSLLIYLAGKGYLKIVESESKSKLFNGSNYKIVKLKDYDGVNEYEEIFFKNLFKEKNEVDKNDLNDKFYKTVNEILSLINSKENKKKIYESQNKWNKFIIIALIILSLISIVYIPGRDYLDTFNIIMILALILFYIPFYAVGFVKSISKKFRIMWLSFTILHSMIFYLSFGIFSILFIRPYYTISFIIGICLILGMLKCFIEMPRRTKYGIEMLGKIRGFKNFLETAEKGKLESMVYENPSYFYDILPYTYVLGISDKWIKKFESINIYQPEWYESSNNFNINNFNTFVNSSMNTFNSSMTSSPSSSSGSSSGGGFSGGGSGGGGGSSW